MPRGHGHCADGSAMHFFKVSEVEAAAKGEGGERASELERTGVSFFFFVHPDPY